MINSEFPDKKNPFCVLAKNEYSVFCYSPNKNDLKIHNMIANYETKEYLSKCKLNGISQGNLRSINYALLFKDRLCKKCFNLGNRSN